MRPRIEQKILSAVAGRSGSVCGRRAVGARKGMGQSLLLGRVLLRFGQDREAESIVGDLSAATLGPDGALWVASDELSGGRITLSRLSPEAPNVFAGHQRFALETYIDLFEGEQDKAEADIEGLDYARGYLWFTGSHSSKRKKPKVITRATICLAWSGWKSKQTASCSAVSHWSMACRGLLGRIQPKGERG